MTDRRDFDCPPLIADIGGTNARFALVSNRDGVPGDIRMYRCADFAGISAAIEQYLGDIEAPRPRVAAVCIATPVTGDHVSMTNHPWSFSIEETRRTLGLEHFTVLNDFTALAMSLPRLQPDEVCQVGSGERVADTPIALVGPGTGLGVSGLTPCGKGWIPLAGEGGHASFSPANARELQILAVLQRRFGHVSSERLVSGAGLVNLREAIAAMDGIGIEPLSPAKITERAIAGSDSLCKEVTDTFCGILGTVAGNLVLTLGARNGVYVGGGIVPKLGDYFYRSPFRARFEDKGRFSNYLADVPSFVITAKYPAFAGLVHVLDSEWTR